VTLALGKSSAHDLVDLYSPEEIQKVISTLSIEEALAIQYDWGFWARPNQLQPNDDWFIWLLLSGRGGGKTRVGSEQTIQWAKEGYSPIALIGRTKADVRDTMIELGDSSILKCSPPWFIPKYEPNRRRLIWPNGVIAVTYSADEPDQLRGPQHKKAWVDELAKFQRAQECWDNLMFGLRIGDKPQVIVTSTPRPIPIVKKLERDLRAVITRTHTLENRANLAPDFLKYIIDKYGGTRLGRQELAGETLLDNPDALWNRNQIDELRVSKHPDLRRVVIAVDPQGSSDNESSETGIVAAGIATADDGKIHGYILADLTLSGTPERWSAEAVSGYHKFKADRIVAEVNFGGDMVESIIRIVDDLVPFKKVHASRGKAIRAEPVSALYEQGRIHHVGFFPELEDQLCEWVTGEKSPDRLDAAVWAITDLMLEKQGLEFMIG